MNLDLRYACSGVNLMRPAFFNLKKWAKNRLTEKMYVKHWKDNKT